MGSSNFIFRCDNDEKNKFMVEAERIGLNASIIMRRMLHLFMTDKLLRDRVLNLQADNQKKE